MNSFRCSLSCGRYSTTRNQSAAAL